MLEWGIHSIFIITVNNASSNDSALDCLKMRTGYKDGAILEDQFMHMRCCPHILNFIMFDGLKEVDNPIVNVMTSTSFEGRIVFITYENG
jgi:hypothetical protein